MWQEDPEPSRTSPAASPDPSAVLPDSPPSRQSYDDRLDPIASFRLSLTPVREVAEGHGLWDSTRQAWGLSVRTEQQDGAIRLLLTGELDRASSPLAEQCVALAQEDHESVIVDLKDLRFMDSSGIHVFLRAATHARNTGDRIQVVNSHKHSRLFTLCGAGFLLEKLGSLRPGSLAGQVGGVLGQTTESSLFRSGA